jgi:hypothetical protein
MAPHYRRISLAFYLSRRRLEFAAGLARHPDGKRVVVS